MCEENKKSIRKISGLRHRNVINNTPKSITSLVATLREKTMRFRKSQAWLNFLKSYI